MFDLTAFAYIYQKVGERGWNNIALPVALHVRSCEGGLGHNRKRFIMAILGKHKKRPFHKYNFSDMFQGNCSEWCVSIVRKLMQI